MNFITNLLLHFAARNVQGILDFVTALDVKLDAIVAQHDTTVAKAIADKSDLDGEYADRLTVITNTISDASNAKSKALALKAALPTA